MYLDTRKSNKGIGHFQLHSAQTALVIGHKELPGYQRVLCHPSTGIIGTGTTPFAVRQNARDLSTRRLTPARDSETAADGGTSTRGP